MRDALLAILAILCTVEYAGATIKAVKVSGDIIMGGLFPMHEKGSEGMVCGRIKEQKGIQRLEAMMYAIDLINNDGQLLPNITLGVYALDTCLRDTFALEQSLEFIMPHMSMLDKNMYSCKNGESAKSSKLRAQPVAGVIGASASPVSIMVANILRLFKIPQISYASTGIELSDKKRFKYFSRVVPTDTYQAQAMADIISRFSWKYISTVGDEGNYGEKGIAAFENLLTKTDACIATSLKIPRDIIADTFDVIMRSLLDNSRARIVVLFVNEDNCRRLIAASIRFNCTRQFIWLASDSWGAKVVPVHGQEAAAEGSITIMPQRNLVPEFTEYFKKLTPQNNPRNPWFGEYWQAHFKCRLDWGDYTQPRCSGSEEHSNFTQEGLVAYVIDSVYTMAHALEDIRKKRCGRYDTGMCAEMTPLDGRELLDAIRKVTFTDWPDSVCSDACSPGYVVNLRGADHCCWVCIRCSDYERLTNDNTCAACVPGTYPNANRTVCEEIPLEHMTFTHPWAIMLITLSTSGILAVVFVFGVFIKYNNTPVIMASGRELSYLLQIGLICCYAMTFVMVAKPGPYSCTCFRLGLGLSLSICYSAIFTKTNRISRIFNRGIKAMVKRPSYTSPRSQVVICGCLVLVQLLIGVTWVGVDYPETALIFPTRSRAILQCKSTNLAVALSLLYNMILISMCTWYAFKTRRIPANFNEAKCIAFTMYATCIVWLAFVPIYFGLDKSDYMVQTAALCVCVSISATAALCCLLAPRIYIVILQPHKNVRQSTRQVSGAFVHSNLFGANSRPYTNNAPAKTADKQHGSYKMTYPNETWNKCYKDAANTAPEVRPLDTVVTTEGAWPHLIDGANDAIEGHETAL